MDNEKAHNTDNITICIDSFENNEFSGRLYLLTGYEAVKFSHSIELLKQINDYLTHNAKEKLSSTLRCFDKKKESSYTPIVKAEKNNIILGGKKATFILKISYMMNTTWQGELCWKERKKTLMFRSELEMCMLITEALGSL